MPASWRTGISDDFQVCCLGVCFRLRVSRVSASAIKTLIKSYNEIRQENHIGGGKTVFASLVLMIAFILILIPIRLSFSEPSNHACWSDLQGSSGASSRVLRSFMRQRSAPLHCGHNPTTPTCINLCWVMGQLMVSGVLGSFNLTRDGYIGTIYNRQCPWWRTCKERHKDAKKCLFALTSRRCTTPFNAVEQGFSMRKAYEQKCSKEENHRPNPLFLYTYARPATYSMYAMVADAKAKILGSEEA